MSNISNINSSNNNNNISSNSNFNLQNEIEQTNSITMDLENLQQQYSNLLISYQQALANYVNFLNQQSNLQCENNTNENANCTQISQSNYNINGDPLVGIMGQAFNGTGSAGESQATNLQDCIASCSNTPNCSGATFVSNQCLLRTGDSPLVPSTQDSYAIVPESVKLLLIMENINQQLININQQITSKMTTANPLYDSQVTARFQQQQTLIKNYEELMKERENILNLLKEYETLDNTSSNDQIKITSNYYTYILLFILAIVFIFLLYKLSSIGSSNSTTQSSMTQYGGMKYSHELIAILCIISIGIILFVYFIKYFRQ